MKGQERRRRQVKKKENDRNAKRASGPTERKRKEYAAEKTAGSTETKTPMRARRQLRHEGKYPSSATSRTHSRTREGVYTVCRPPIARRVWLREAPSPACCRKVEYLCAAFL